MRLFDQDSVHENLDIARENLDELKNEMLWLLEHYIDDRPDQLDPIALEDCRKCLRLIVEHLPPLLFLYQREHPSTETLCGEMRKTCDYLRHLHPSSDPEVWSATYTAAQTLGNYIDELQSEPGPSATTAPDVFRSDKAIDRRLEKVEPSNEFVLVGDHFRIRYQDRELTLKNLVGLRCIRELLRQPQKEIFAGELSFVAAGKGIDWSAVVDTLADERSLQSYRQELERKEGERDCLASDCSAEYREALDSDIRWIESEIRRITGLGGKLRKADSPREKVRKSVSRNIRYSLDQIGRHHRQLESHLGGAIHMGMYLCYRPDREIEWKI